MYHELTYRELARRRRNRIIAAACVLVLCVILVVASLAAARATREQSVQAVHDAVLQAAVQCAAVEGSFPSSVAHLEDAYGLTYTHNRFLVYYEWLGDNVPPTVTVGVR